MISTTPRSRTFNRAGAPPPTPPVSLELIREAMELYRSERLHPTRDLSGFRPRSAGKVLRPLTRQDDLLAEMLERGQ
jgi:hypothetical protein